MKLSNKTYDRLKWFALVFIPTLEFLILTLGDIWGFAHYIEIGQTIAALGVFLTRLTPQWAVLGAAGLQLAAFGLMCQKDGGQA